MGISYDKRRKNMLKIHDIKNIVEIPDNSIYLFYALIIFSILLVLLLLFLTYQYFKLKKPSKQKEYYKILQNINFDNQKESAYTISKYGQLLAKEELEVMLIDELIDDLEEYKYKKNISNTISDNIKNKYHRFMEIVNVK